MDLQGIIFFIFAVLGIWLTALSIVNYRIFRYFKSLSKDVTKDNLITILERVVDREKQNSRGIEELSRSLQNFEEKSRKNLQKISLLRFNPFKELGGEHSFVLTLLDADDNGVIITGLHTRERTRVYIKNVKKGKVDVELSSEEKKSLLEAKKSKN
ncbi:hypothetical protein A2715_00235 [Candidatus Woesebacteria bacterium RIFCSPHIGHO2_01_FULL_39_32]|uniref:DUF4446 domain-containing protein n=2 Tax=Candidatus Woeseibacteriota TaxID=1752722 RepID=A0A0G0PR49_9BACT|nr:MAG: hypothetical protein UT61_C0004G0026 [Candidatus Woesebacteria bacterium GW2011_GWA1_39_8]OGM03788.1 MAG: hypothetical protein A2124_00355 [Candidatus Woesebacteria bacterium GWB1_37_5]OGM24253.1 MAG: hypothetical protein A2715_00235 [Candidatus Woesebacteria bacterium RIFCSPHIGHO2_01_FULL_39_32]OGM35380.1 MAG: hypothetical protein A3F01_04590 [Candidatus Woesebacteria bacterium RIFCSPHIGHO2_12_FULL_38_11]OGM65324.1 MAG: hypothetical protein A2893_01190 [Candidatus Woesebacteria bacteri